MQVTVKYLIILSLTFNSLFAQQQPNYKITYQQLKQYEGTYEYSNHSTLQMAVSPKDTTLYAIVEESKYPLRFSRQDVFLNNGNQEVRFTREGSSVKGYRVNDATPDVFYKILSKEIAVSDKSWFPRGNGVKPYHWHYSVPADLGDGIAVESIVNSGLDTALVHTMINRIVNGTYKNIHSVLIVKNNRLMLEEYFYENDITTVHQLRSATKSFSSALIGIAIDQHLIKDKNEKVLSYFPEYKIQNRDARKESITIENLLTQQAGFDCNDRDEHSPGNEVKIYPTHDWLKYVLDLPMIDSPGHEGHYCSGNIFLLNRIVEKSSAMKLHEFAGKYLFDKLGVSKFDWDFVPDETHQNSYSQVSLRPRDMAKFGMLYLNHGKWKNEQVLSSEWVEQSITKHSLVDGIDYGYLWWCEQLTANGKVFQGAAAKGNGGQRIFIWPALNMMVVITAGNYNTQSPANQMLMECILAGVKK